MISKYELEELLEELEKIRGSHTELVSVYIPAGQNINVINSQIENEKSTASNIKSKSNRKNVVDALESISRELKLYKVTPENGMAIFCGNVSEKEGQQDLKLWAIEPPLPLKVRMYRCDKQFVLEPLKEMLEAEFVYGLVVMDRKEATLALLEGKQVKILRKMTSGVPGKYKTGGQCLAEETIIVTKKGIKRIEDVAIGDYIKALDINNKKIIFTKCINKWKREKGKYLQIILRDYWFIVSSFEHTFFKEVNNKIAEVKAETLSLNDSLITYYDNELSALEIKSILKVNKKMNMIDIETEAGNFFANGILVHNSAQRFERIREGMAKEFYRRIAEHMKELYFNLPRLKGIIIGGPVPTKEDFLKEGQLVTQLKEKVIGLKDIGYADEHGIELLVEASGDFLAEQEITHEKQLLENFLERLGKNDKVAYKKEDIEKAIKYGAVDLLILSKKLGKKEILDYRKKAENISAKIEIVSVETPEGEQFWNLGGIGALLRFEV